MKKPKDSTDLAALLQTAATTPALTVAALEPAQPQPIKAKKGAASVAVYLRLPADLHSSLEKEAIARTKKTGKGVTVQQIIIEKLGG